MKNLKQQLHNMYVGLVFTHWSKEGTSLGTAKQKALQQMQNYSKTLDKNNPVAQQITANVNEMTRDISKQIMTNKSSNMVLDKNQASQYREFGKQQIEQSKKSLNDLVQRAKKFAPRNASREQLQEMEDVSKLQDMHAKKNASQYCANNTNESKNAPKPTAPQKMDQQIFMRIMLYQRYQNAA